MFKQISKLWAARKNTPTMDSPPEKVAAHWHEEGLQHQQAGRWEDVLRCTARARQLAPGALEYRLTMANAFLALDNPEEAIQVLEEALTLGERTVDILTEIGSLALQVDDLPKARNAAQRLNEREERLPGLLLLGRVAIREKDWESAQACYLEAIRLEPAAFRPINGLGTVYLNLGNWAEAERCFLAAHALQPDAYEPLNNLGLLREHEGGLDEAIQFFEQAAQLNPRVPQVRFNTALARLKKGDYLNGWSQYEIRFYVPGIQAMLPRRDESRLWTGGDITGKDLLILGEQGFGDQIQFVRYLPLLAERGARLHLTCYPELIPLFSSLRCEVSLYAMGGDVPSHDVQCAVMSLPALLGTTLDAIPATVPYLQAPVAKVANWSARLSQFSGRRVGVVWFSRNPYAPRLSKQVPIEALVTLWQVPGCCFFSLQKDRDGQHPLPGPMHDLAPDLHDFSDTAAALEALDIVITVDTAVAHLAGALGRPVWLLAKSDACWRWLLERSDSPWYPSMTIFRQKADEGWEEVAQRMAEQLALVG